MQHLNLTEHLVTSAVFNNRQKSPTGCRDHR